MSDELDPFEDPTPRVSKRASADSFRNRLIMIEPTQVERNVPKMASEPTGAKGDKITATVTLMDGQGSVQAFSEGDPTGLILEGPVYRGVWFNQDQITEGLQTPRGELRKRVLCRINTLKGEGRAKRGNPWIIIPATTEEKAAAAKLLAEGIVGAATQAPAASPFEKQPPF